MVRVVPTFAALCAGVVILAPSASKGQQLTSNDSSTSTRVLDRNHPDERLLKGGETQSYSIVLDPGAFLKATVDQRGIDVVVRLFDPSGNKITDIDSPNGANGPEPIALTANAAGKYRIEITSLTATDAPGHYAIRVDEILTAGQHTAELAAARQRRASVDAWLKRNAIPLKGVAPGIGTADLAPFRHALTGVQFVGLGEASHGSRELFQLKSRMVEFLVRDMGFRILALELDFAACQHINDYIQGNTSDTTFILKPWDTEEVTGLLSWLRTYNARVTQRDRVTIVGIDGQDRVRGDSVMLAYIKRIAPERAAETAAMFSDTTFPAKLKDERAKTLQHQYVELFMFFELNGARLIAASSAAEYGAMRELARVLVEPGYDYRNDIDIQTSLDLRDSYMADNFRRMVDRASPETRVILWAHNGHVETTDSPHHSMGYYLRALYGNRYYALASTFYSGEFLAWDAKSPVFALQVYQARPVPEDAIEEDFIRTRLDPFIIDFRSTLKTSAVTEWLATPHAGRSIGGEYNHAFDGFPFPQVTLHGSFDGELFTRSSMAARPTSRMRDRYRDH